MRTAEMVGLYESGATIQKVANAGGCSYERARRALLSAGVELRQQPRLVRTPVAIPPRPCPDCGERLDRPHVLGAHLPGREYGTATPAWRNARTAVARAGWAKTS